MKYLLMMQSLKKEKEKIKIKMNAITIHLKIKEKEKLIGLRSYYLHEAFWITTRCSATLENP